MKKIISSLLRSFKNIFWYRVFKSCPKRTMQPSPYKGRIVPVNMSFANQDLSHQDFTGTDFSNCDMKDTILTGCVFDKANLSQVQNLTEKQFAGCSLIDAILPKDFKFSYLDNFDKMMTQARDIFALSLSTSLFGIIAVMSTADEDFLVGGKSLTMPLIGVAVDMTSLYIFLPITIMAVGLYLNIYLNKIQSIIKKFPYYLPDGREIELLLYPWLWNYITKPLYHKKRKLRLSYAMFAWLGGFISYAMVHVTAGLSIMIITFTYFKVQDPFMTSFHLSILGIVTFFAFLHFRIKYRERKFVLSFLMPISAFAFTVMMAVCGSFVYKEKPIFVNGQFRKIHDIFFNPYITATYKKISQNSSGCATPKRNELGHIIENDIDYKSCQNVTGVDLRNRNLMNLNAPNSFFVNALLKNSNLQYANLENADLRWSDLKSTNLQNINFSFANLQDADLDSSNLQNVNFSFANLQNVDLSHSNLKEINIRSANLKNVNFLNSKLQNAKIIQSNLNETDFGLANLEGAIFEKKPFLDRNLSQLVGSFLKKSQNTDLSQSFDKRVSSEINAKTSFAMTNLKNVSFLNENLHDANFSFADLNGTKFENTALIRTNFFGAKLNHTDFSHSMLQDTNFIMMNLQKVNFSEANLENASFSESHLSDINFTKASFTKGSFMEANLENVIFKDARLTGVFFNRAKLKNVNFENAILKNSTFGRAKFDNVNFSGVDFSGSILSNIDLSSVIINDNTKFENAFYNSRQFVDVLTMTTIFPYNFNPIEKGMIDICTPYGKEALKQAIQNNQYSATWEKTKDSFEKDFECVPPES